MRLQTTEYDSLTAAVEAARVAEDYLKALTQIKNHHIQIQAQANAVQQTPLEKMDRRSSRSRDDRSQSKGDNRCFNCNGTDHWARECPYRRDGDKGSPAKISKSGSFTDLKETVRALTQQVNKISENMGNPRRPNRSRSSSRGRQLRFSRPRSQDRTRSGSRHRSSSRDSRGSRYDRSQSRDRYRNRSRDRSDSRGRYRRSSKN